MLPRIAALLIVLSLAAPAAALAQSSPFTPQPPAAGDTQTQTTPVTISNSQAADNGGISGAGKAAIIAVGALLLAGIAWLIVRDARGRAPVVETEAGPKGTMSPQRHARARAKAKRAKQQRKRNRARR